MKATIKISGERIVETVKESPSAFKCAELLAGLKMSATTYDTFSAVDDANGDWYVEIGVVINLYNCTKKGICDNLWPALQEKFNLECAHVHESGGFSGCMYDYSRTSICPVNMRRVNKMD